MKKDDPAHSVGITRSLHVRRHHLPHWQVGGSVYFITFRTTGVQLPEMPRRAVADVIRHSHGKYYDLHLAVVMPDHVHMLIRPRQKTVDTWFDLAEITKNIKGISARRVNQLMGTAGAVWQKESFDRIVRDEKEYAEKWGYMTHNPVKAGLVDDSNEYEFIIRADENTRR